MVLPSWCTIYGGGEDLVAEHIKFKVEGYIKKG